MPDPDRRDGHRTTCHGPIGERLTGSVVLFLASQREFSVVRAHSRRTRPGARISRQTTPWKIAAYVKTVAPVAVLSWQEWAVLPKYCVNDLPPSVTPSVPHARSGLNHSSRQCRFLRSLRGLRCERGVNLHRTTHALSRVIVERRACRIPAS